MITATTTTTTTRRLVNVMVGRIRDLTPNRHHCEPRFVEGARGGAWGAPHEAIAYAALLAARHHADMAIRIVDVNTHEEWYLTVPASYTIERHNGERDRYAIRHLNAQDGVDYLGPFSQADAEHQAVDLNVFDLYGGDAPSPRRLGT